MSPSNSDYALAGRSGIDAGGPALEEEATVALEGSAPDSTTRRSSTVGDMRHTIDRQELRGDQDRFRQAALLGAVLWPAFWPLDWLAHTWVEPVSLGWFTVARVLPVPYALLLARLVAADRVVSRRRLLFYESSMFALASGLMALMIADFRGLESPYFAGLTLVMLVRAAFMPQPWRRSLPTMAICWGAAPLVLGCAALVDADVARQWASPSARGVFILQQANLTWTAVIAVLGGHAVSELRRSVFEARAVGRYRLKRRLGRGAMGEVWAAGHPRLKQEVAIKLLDQRLSASASAVARFEREVEATARLAHPNTVRILDYGVTDDGLWYYAMELLEGSDLAALVRDAGPLPAARAARIVLQAARAIGEAHDQGVVHRDLKPENVFVVKKLRDVDLVKVLDFGIASQSDLLDATNLTQEGAFLGTPRYASPEIASGQRATARSDVYGLAGILYFLLTATPPFAEASLGELMAARLLRDVEPPSTRLGFAVPQNLEAIVLKGLVREPENRFADANAFADALDDWLAAAGAGGAGGGQPV
ncbi:MAG TPA: serine/threonine-protein kinase [Thermoanaerobaculia bacterium]|nr:serine/threonine-protein kinase [Thermoanaerobaculia bacterium]